MEPRYFDLYLAAIEFGLYSRCSAIGCRVERNMRLRTRVTMSMVLRRAAMASYRFRRLQMQMALCVYARG